MFNKIELFAAAISIVTLVTAVYLYQTQQRLAGGADDITSNRIGNTAVVIDASANPEQTAATLREATNERGGINRLIIDDVKIGSGQIVEVGDEVTIHYVGRLQSGQEFDNSRKQGEAFSFEVGAGRAIEGLEQGVVGMKAGGERVLVIPASLAYGEDGFGPIPANATLIFSVELIEIE